MLSLRCAPHWSLCLRITTGVLSPRLVPPCSTCCRFAVHLTEVCVSKSLLESFLHALFCTAPSAVAPLCTGSACCCRHHRSLRSVLIAVLRSVLSGQCSPDLPQTIFAPGASGIRGGPSRPPLVEVNQAILAWSKQFI